MKAEVCISAQMIKLNALSSRKDFELQLRSAIMEHETFHGLLILGFLYLMSTSHHGDICYSFISKPALSDSLIKTAEL